MLWRPSARRGRPSLRFGLNLVALGAGATLAACGDGGGGTSGISLPPLSTTTTTAISTTFRPIPTLATLTTPDRDGSGTTTSAAGGSGIATSAAGGGSAASTSAGSGAGTTAAAAGAWVNATGNLAGMASECGNLSSLSVRPDADVVLAGVAKQGLWASTDATATTWSSLAPGTSVTGRPRTYVYDPDHAGTFWVATIYGSAGVYRTTDGGKSFTALGDVAHVDAVSVDLSDPARKVLLAGTHEKSDLRRSTDGGATWAPLPNLPPDPGFTFAPYVVDATTYLLGTSNSAGAGIFRTTDAGATWTQVHPGAVSGQPLLVGNQLYWVVGHDLVSSADQGATWTLRSSGKLDYGGLAALPDGKLAGIVGSHIATSADSGATWVQIGQPVPVDINSLSAMVYAAPRRAFYISHFDCQFTANDPVLPDAVLRLDVK